MRPPESLSAYVALVRPLVRVYFSVLTVDVLRHKRLLAKITLVRSVAGVFLDVIIPVAFDLEGLRALGTSVGPQVRVDFEVSVESRRLRESLTANRTLVGSFTRVHPDVFDQGHFVGEALLAVLAMIKVVSSLVEHGLVGMSGLPVLCHLFVSRKLKIAESTQVGQRLLMLRHVNGQCSVMQESLVAVNAQIVLFHGQIVVVVQPDVKSLVTKQRLVAIESIVTYIALIVRIISVFRLSVIVKRARYRVATLAIFANVDAGQIQLLSGELIPHKINVGHY